MRIVAGQYFPRLGGFGLGHIGPQGQLRGVVQGPVFFGRGEIRIVRRPPGQHEKEGLPRRRMVAQVLLRVPRLGDGVVALPVKHFRAVGVVGRVIVVVRALQHLPVIKPLPPFARDEARAAMRVHMPLADIRGVVARRAQHLGDGHRFRVQRHVVQEDPVREWALARQE